MKPDAHTFVTLALLCAAASSCGKHDKHEEVAAPVGAHSEEMKAKLVSEISTLKAKVAACATPDCKRDVRARAIRLANDALIEHRVATSLVDVEGAISKWRSGKSSALTAHGAVLRHNVRCERTTEQLVAAVDARPEGILREALDAGLISTADFVVLTGKQPSEVESLGAMSEEGKAPGKRETVDELLARGPILVHIDARRPDVSVPANHRNADLVLRFGRTLSPPMTDLVVDELGLSATLKFDGGKTFHCVVPWSAIYGVLPDGEEKGTTWADDVPEDVTESKARQHLP